MTNPLVLQIDSLRAAIRELMRGFGSQPTEVELVTENLLQANLTGHDSHGIGMLPRYGEAFREGWLQPNAHVEIRRDSGAVLSLDGRAGFGQVIGQEAWRLGSSAPNSTAAASWRSATRITSDASEPGPKWRSQMASSPFIS